jgi:hypothetical protein
MTDKSGWEIVQNAEGGIRVIGMMRLCNTHPSKSLPSPFKTNPTPPSDTTPRNFHPTKSTQLPSYNVISSYHLNAPYLEQIRDSSPNYIAAVYMLDCHWGPIANPFDAIDTPQKTTACATPRSRLRAGPFAAARVCQSASHQAQLRRRPIDIARHRTHLRSAPRRRSRESSV